jgi:hypothetical protein
VSKANQIERPVGQQPEPERTCEQGCNGCDECTDYDECREDEEVCERCHGDGMDPWNDYLLPCPLCLGDAKL